MAGFAKFIGQTIFYKTSRTPRGYIVEGRYKDGRLAVVTKARPTAAEAEEALLGVCVQVESGVKLLGPTMGQGGAQ